MDWIAPLAGKVALKVGMNAVVPCSGTIVDIVEAGYCLYNGDLFGAGVNITSAAVDFFTFGFWGAAKDAAKAGGKEAAVQATKQAVKQTFTQEIGKDAGMTIAFNAAKKKAGRDLAKYLAAGGVSETTEEVFKSLTKVTGESVIKESFRGGIASGGKDILKSALSSGLEETFTGTLQIAAKTTARQAFIPSAVQTTVESVVASTLSSAASDIDLLKNAGTITMMSLNCLK